MMLFVARLQTLEDLQRLGGRWLVDEDGRKAALERGIFFDALAIFVVGGRADHAQLSTRQGRFEHVGCIQRAFGVARANERVQLVDKQDDFAIRGLRLGDHRLQPLFELAAELCPGNEQAHVYRNHALAFEWLGHLARSDTLGEAFDDGRLTDARLANQHRIVLGAAHQDFHEPQNLVFAANDRIELAVGGQRGQIDTIFFERLEATLGSRAVDGSTTAHFIKSTGEYVALQASALGSLGQLVVGIGQQRQQQMLGTGELIAPLLSISKRLVERVFGPRSDVNRVRLRGDWPLAQLGA